MILRRSALGITLLSLVLTGCKTDQVDSNDWIQNASDRTLVEVPKSFKRISPDPFKIDKFDLDAARVKGATRDPSKWIRIFDSAAKPSEEHFNESRPEDLVGKVAVYTLEKEWRSGPHFRDGLNMATMRSLPLGSRDAKDPIAEFNDGNPDIEIINYEEIARPNGIRGIKIRYNERVGASEWVTYDHQAYTNTKTDKLYALTMLCSSTCFKKKYNTVRQISSSFSVQQ